jgi:tyrosyl-tRNA synthetase
LWIIDLLKTLQVVQTNSEGRRLIEQGAVSIDGTVIKDGKAEITMQPGMIVKAGKHKIFKLA